MRLATEAVAILNERKSALFGEGPDHQLLEPEAWRRLLIGLDVDFRDIAEASAWMAESVMDRITANDSPFHVLAGIWLDGCMTGLIMREEA